jgi:hypothetical protein
MKKKFVGPFFFPLFIQCFSILLISIRFTRKCQSKVEKEKVEARSKISDSFISHAMELVFPQFIFLVFPVDAEIAFLLIHSE